MSEKGIANLYLHIPFCRSKCTYCALHSRAGVDAGQRAGYIRRLSASLQEMLSAHVARGGLGTIYFGGGSPLRCELDGILALLAPYRSAAAEVTVEVHPLDVEGETLQRLRDGGVNRISMGVQSLDDEVLADMHRGYSAAEAHRAFDRVHKVFDNAGIDLIVGYPNSMGSFSGAESFDLADWGLRHCSVYSLILEERSILAHQRRTMPSDDEVMDALGRVSGALSELGLVRYEISNYAQPGFECRHNLAVWRGEDYLGVGEGAYGRLGLQRTRGVYDSGGIRYEVEDVAPEDDAKERTIFRIRTNEGLDASRFTDWQPVLNRFVGEGLLTCEGSVYRLTARGMEVCDTVLSELV